MEFLKKRRKIFRIIPIKEAFQNLNQLTQAREIGITKTFVTQKNTCVLNKKALINFV